MQQNWFSYHYPRHIVSLLMLSVCALAIAGFGGNAVASSNYTKEQQIYLDAKAALDKKQLNKYKQLRKQIPNYPLNIYLDYHEQSAGIMKMSGKDAKKALAKFETTALYNTLRYRYLSAAGEQKRWQDFLTISPDTPRDVTLQCYYNRAQLQRGDKQIGYKGAEQLWLHGRSRPKACDPLFKVWTKAGKRTDALIWQRMLLSFNANQTSLLRWLGKKLPSRKAEVDLLLKVYSDPNSLRHTRKFSGSQKVVGDIVYVGLRKLAKRDLKQATKLYQKYDNKDRFSQYESHQLNHYLVRRALVHQKQSVLAYADSQLKDLDSDDLVEMRLRWAIRDADLKALAQFMPLLSEKAKANARWQYWQARLDSKPGQFDSAMYDPLSKNRNFYGFYAAEQIKVPFSMNNKMPASDSKLKAKLYDDPGFARVIELRAIDKLIDARGEWVALLRRQDKAMRAEYGLYALNQQWYDLGVESSIQAKTWNALKLRFPPAEKATFKKASKKYQVSEYETRAISRRESAFYPYATSGVGARGLMQLMPATAKQTAKRNKLKYAGTRSLYKPELNIMLGSAYYGQLVDQYNGNRVLATAAYNAGPSNVKRWLKRSDGKLDVMSFIESIPYRETREYVQAVFSYRLIFQYQEKVAEPMFSEQELAFKY
ncbi:transglycosylase SLT domain-containing protein [Shewanella sp. WXL01]|uniref:transglycosylase SLT domain-containing protein n=1 Tax=Shewanella sp. WXL01 TaxID=2709721 RepID=UPI0014385E09|nr:transglycosylase SLT domain-containing protein [Shewanella sp. WXL01]NKF50357.1 transglycosylase SLT domain-containing protein [Shewanella sp. WXL01]